MRLAVISDIHGECFALEQVLKDIRRQGIEQVVCLGDAVQGGSQPAETVARLRELHCPVVMGNADAWLLTGTSAEGEETSEQQRAVREWSLAQLGERSCFYPAIPAHAGGRVGGREDAAVFSWLASFFR